jgi:hypothetical protein
LLRGRRRQLSLASLLVVVVVAGVVLVPRLFDRGPSTAAERRAVNAYVAAVRPAARRGGQVVVEGIRPRLSDLELGQVDADQFRLETSRWKTEMEQARRAFAVAPVPTRLKPAAALYDRALRTYLQAIDAFVAASYQPRGAQLDAAMAAAVKVAESADKLYDRAGRLVAAEQRRVGDRGPAAP